MTVPLQRLHNVPRHLYGKMGQCTLNGHTAHLDNIWHSLAMPRPEGGPNCAETLSKCATVYNHLMFIVPSYHIGAGEHRTDIEAVCSLLKH